MYIQQIPTLYSDGWIHRWIVNIIGSSELQAKIMIAEFHELMSCELFSTLTQKIIELIEFEGEGDKVA